MIGLEYPDISPIIFSVGPIVIRWYSMAYLVGIISAWLLIRRNVKQNNIPLTKDNIEDLVFDVTLGIIFAFLVLQEFVKYGKILLSPKKEKFGGSLIYGIQHENFNR